MSAELDESPVLLLLTYDPMPDRREDYFRFVLGEFVPTSGAAGLAHDRCLAHRLRGLSFAADRIRCSGLDDHGLCHVVAGLPWPGGPTAGLCRQLPSACGAAAAPFPVLACCRAASESDLRPRKLRGNLSCLTMTEGTDGVLGESGNLVTSNDLRVWGAEYAMG